MRHLISCCAKIEIGTSSKTDGWNDGVFKVTVAELANAGLEENAVIDTIENIDVIWLELRAIAHAFEVEHTTAIYSGLLRMADLLAMQPRMNISLHIVAPTERRDQVRREIVRPVFSVPEGGAMVERCSFLSYDAVDKILEQPNLVHMRETIIEDYEEYFDLV